MHDTLLPSIKSNIDVSETTESGTVKIVGWVFNNEESLPLNSLRLLLDPELNAEESKVVTYETFTERKDVSKFYKNQSINFCGINWEFDNEDYKTGHLQTLVGDDYKTFKVLKLKEVKPKELIEHVTVDNSTPNLIVVENFYNDPDAVRNYAMSLKYETSEWHKGHRTQGEHTFFEGTKEAFEKVLGKKITKWDYGMNGVFQYCTAQDQLVYHTDGQKYAAVVFLTPDAPPQCGTSFFRHKDLKISSYDTKNPDKNLYWEMFKGNFYDGTPWELVDVAGNVYNRMVLWDAHRVHAASEYFGNDIQNSRLFHMFFFDAE